MDDYIRYLRGLVGHKPVILCGSSVIVYKDGRMLLQKRKDNGCWGAAGGYVEMGEAVEDAAKRELFEETGLNAHSLRLLGVFSGSELHYIYPNGDEVHNVDIAFTCDDFSGEFHAQQQEVEALEWFDVSDLPENLNPPSVPAIRAFVERTRDNQESN